MLDAKKNPNSYAYSSNDEVVDSNFSQSPTTKATTLPSASFERPATSAEAQTLADSEYEFIPPAEGLESDPNVGTTLTASVRDAASSLGRLGGDTAVSFLEHFDNASQGFDQAVAITLAAGKNLTSNIHTDRLPALAHPTARQINEVKPMASLLTTFTPLGTVKIAAAALCSAGVVLEECYNNDIHAASALSQTANSLGSAATCAVDALGNIIGTQSSAENRRRSSSSTVLSQTNTTTTTALSITTTSISLASSSEISPNSGAVVVHTENSYSQTHATVTSSVTTSTPDKAR
jgi:hypothetical protein